MIYLNKNVINMIRISETVKHLIIINVILFIATLIIGDRSMFSWLAMHAFENPSFKSWQVITHMFMHAGIPHLLFNMLALWMFGSSVEYALSSKRFLTLYMLSGLGAVILQFIYYYTLGISHHASMVGASGCIMGVMVAFAMMNPEAELMMIFLPIPIKAKYFVPGIIILDIVSAFTGQSFFSPSNTAYMAHVGGALAGLMVTYYFKRTQFNKNRWY